MMTPIQTAVPLAMVAIALLTQGCKSVNSVERAEPVNQRQMVSDKRIITDPSLARKVQILGVNEATLPGGYLKVQVEVRNATRVAQDFSYRFDWLDASGMHLRTATAGFIPQHIQGAEHLYVIGVAPSSDAKDFQVKFIEQ